jgi:hypothetical protein
MTDRERLMYEIISRISATNAPLVFKGALITKLVLQENGFTGIDRKTIDIDANWIDTPPSMEVLFTTINQALGNLQNKLMVVEKRRHGEHMTAGVSFLNKATGGEIVSMDIEISSLSESKLYYYGNATIKGVLPDNILADKITAVSDRLVFRRAKDLIDIYALSHCVQVQTKKIFTLCAEHEKDIKSFEPFYIRQADVEHAYEKLKGVDGKPDFATVYVYLSRFFKPFALKEMTAKIWDSASSEWKTPLRERSAIPSEIKAQPPEITLQWLDRRNARYEEYEIEIAAAGTRYLNPPPENIPDNLFAELEQRREAIRRDYNRSR